MGSRTILWAICFGELEKESKAILSGIWVGGVLLAFAVFFITRFSSASNMHKQGFDTIRDYSKMAAWQLSSHWVQYSFALMSLVLIPLYNCTLE